MKLIKELREGDLGIEVKEISGPLEVRNAVRAVVFDAEGLVGVAHVADGNYWKIPGGGVEKGESFPQALERELLEEAGVSATTEGEIGVIVEHRDQWSQLQISYCYLACVNGEKKTPEFDEKERSEGFSFHWMSYEEALKKFKENTALSYEAKFMQTRDRMFLELAGRVKK
jgi:8-oxo-dGTP diphosphatase